MHKLHLYESCIDSEKQKITMRYLFDLKRNNAKRN